jgi:uncharacterized MAPEG superfamily protein
MPACSSIFKRAERVLGASVLPVHGFARGLGPRERSVFQRRMDRLVASHVEGLAVFAALVTVGHLAGISTPATEAGAVAFAAARGAFAAVYALGIPCLRSAVWGVGAAALPVMAAAIGSAALG